MFDFYRVEKESDYSTVSNRANTELPMAKKRKSIDIIELGDSNSDDSHHGEKLDLIVEEEQSKKFKPDQVIEIESSSSSSDLTKKPQAEDRENEKLENNQDESDIELLNENELLSLLNKTTPKVGTAPHQATQIFSQPNKSLGEVFYF